MVNQIATHANRGALDVSPLIECFQQVLKFPQAQLVQAIAGLLLGWVAASQVPQVTYEALQVLSAPAQATPVVVQATRVTPATSLVSQTRALAMPLVLPH